MPSNLASQARYEPITIGGFSPDHAEYKLVYNQTNRNESRQKEAPEDWFAVKIVTFQGHVVSASPCWPNQQDH